MRTLSRLAVLGTLTALAAAPSAFAAPSATVSLSPGKAGSLTVAAPTSFQLKTQTPDAPYDPSGNARLKALKAYLPEQLLFNQQGFTQCPIASFVGSRSCPSKSKLGSATVIANGGPEVENITATTTLYYGEGFTILARVESSAPAVIDEAVIGELRSSGVKGYGLQMYIPIPGKVAEPSTGLFPVVRSVDAKVTPPTQNVRVPGERKKIKLPLAGLGDCKRETLRFRVDTVYTDAAGVNETRVDSASATTKCK